MTATSENSSGTGSMPLQHFWTYRDYRCYLTPEYWLITYRDSDLIRVMRNTEHKPGFLLLIIEVLYSLLVGVRTELREKWALHERGYETDSHELDLECRAAARRVIEFDFHLTKPRIKREQEL